jgi:hypothetical protein
MGLQVMAAAAQSWAKELNRSCHCVSTDVPALQSWLVRDLKQRGLSEPIVTTHPHLFSASPVFIDRLQVAKMRRAIAAIESVIALPAYQELVLRQAPDIAKQAQSARGIFLGYDFHLTDDGPKLIEINTNAGGALLNVEMMRAQQACCPEVLEYLQTQPKPSELESHFMAMFADEWRAAAIAGRPLQTIAIVDEQPQAQYLYPEFLLFARLFDAHGIQAVIASPEELVYRDGALWAGLQQIDLVYNRVTDFYFETPQCAALRDAYRDNAVVVTPHPRSHALYANKHNLSLLSDESILVELGVDVSTRAELLQSIPRTVPVSAHDAETWWRERKRWFFKPAGGFGGRGSYRGDKLTKGAFADVMNGDYIAQHCVPPSERWISPSNDERPLKFDVRNYVYRGETQLLAARLYQGQTTNFRTAGGGFAPVYSL